MNYTNNLIEKIIDSNKWPAFERGDFLQELNDIADKSISSNTVEGSLAAVLIYHQLCEEIVKLLIECSEFYIQIAIFPAEISFNKGNNLMFGQLLKQLENGVSFPNKKELLDKCRELNEIRIRMVHKLTMKSSTADIKKQVKKIKHIYNQVFEYFEIADDHYRHAYDHYKKNCDWEELKENS